MPKHILRQQTNTLYDVSKNECMHDVKSFNLKLGCLFLRSSLYILQTSKHPRLLNGERKITRKGKLTM